MRERRKARRAPLVEELRRQRAVAAIEQYGKQRMFGIVRLQDHVARALRATGTTRDLHDELAEPFGRAEVDAVQAFVDADHDDERQVRQIVAFGQHLRADQDARAGRRQVFEQRVARVPAARRVAVDTHDGRVGKVRAQRFLEPLGALSDRMDRESAAHRTRARDRLTESAVMAAQAPRRLMQRQRALAIRTLRAPAAVVAHQHRRVAAAVLEDQCLFVARDAGRDRVQRRRRKTVLQRLPAEVDDGERRAAARSRRDARVAAHR